MTKEEENKLRQGGVNGTPDNVQGGVDNMADEDAYMKYRAAETIKNQRGMTKDSAVPDVSPVTAGARDAASKVADGLQNAKLSAPTDVIPKRTHAVGGAAMPTKKSNLSSLGVDAGGGYADVEEYWNRALKANEPEDDKTKARRERTEKWEGMINGIADMGAALGNLYFATKGAPSSYDPKESMTAKARERWDKDKAERDARDKRYYDFAMKRAEWEHKKAQLDSQKAYRDALATKWKEDAEFKYYNADLKERIKQGEWDLKREELQIKKDYNDGKISNEQMKLRLTAARDAEQARHHRETEKDVTTEKTVTETKDTPLGQQTNTRTEKTVKSRGGNGGNGKKLY